MKFELFRRRTLLGRRWYFRGTAKNGEIVLQSEGYRNYTDAQSTLEMIRNEAATATVDIEEK